MRVRKVTTLVLAVVIGLAALTSCGSPSHDPEPLEQSDSDTSASDEEQDAGSSASESKSPFPGQDVTEAAQAWLDASNTAMETLDPEPMLALSAPDCENCQHSADYLRDLKENGGQLNGNYTEVPRSVQAPDVNEETATVTITVERGPYTEVSEAGASPRNVEADTYDIEFHLKLENGSWIVTEMVPMTEE